MIVLSIETSCDETAVCIVKSSRGKHVRFEVLSHKILSQIDLHREYGGVFPSLAKREHAKAITQLIAECLEEAGLLIERTNSYHLSHEDKHRLGLLLEREPEMLKAMIILFEGIQKPKIDAIAVTSGPGLEPALWVGINAALALKQAWDIPVYPINHMEGHILTGLFHGKDSAYEIIEPSYPTLALLVSGGHTELVRMSGMGKYHVIGQTKDDAAGEAFDKTARLLDLPYPGGPEIARLAKRARDRNAVVPESLRLPRPMIKSGDLSFSFSGLKTAVMTRVKKYGPLSEEHKEMLAMEFENAVADVFVAKVKQALYETGASSLVVGGGVSANDHLRHVLEMLAASEHVELYVPERKLSGDNALMIAATGLSHIERNKPSKTKIIADGSWSIESV